VIEGASDAALVQHDGGVALQTSDGSLTYGVFTPAGATVRKLVVQEAVVLPSGSLQIDNVEGLQQVIDDARDIRTGLQGQLGGLANNLVYAQQDLTDLTGVVAEKATTTELTTGLLTRATVSSLVAGLSSKQDKIDSLSAITLSGITASTVTAGGLTSGAISAYVPGDSNNLVVAAFASDASVLKVNGAFIDSYKTDNSARTLYLNYLNNNNVQVGSKLSVGQASGNHQFTVNGAALFTSFVSANNYITTSDQRIKENVLDASLEECTRLVLAVRPKTYTRIDMNDAPRLGYIANQFDRELTGGYRCIMGASEDENGALLALDYSRIVPILHGALLSALSRISALETRA
jgi:hypothetical protein